MTRRRSTWAVFGAVALAATTVVPPPAHAAGGFTALPGAVSPLAALGGNYNVGTHVTVDVDSDGDLDVAVREPVSDATIDVLRNDGGAFTTLTGAASPFASISFPSSPTNFLNSRVLTGDFDVDGDVDLWHHGVGFAAFYRNDDGTFSAHTGAADPLAQLASYDPGTYEVIDVDGDTDPDVVAREPTGDASLVLLRNDGGTFVASAAPLAAVAFGAHASNFLNVNVLVLDADDDGDLDLWHHGVGFAAFYRNDGGTFSAHTGAADPLAELAGYYSHSYVTADVDSDGDLDVVAREPSGGLTIDVLRNDGGGFTRLTGAASPFAAVTLATTDFETAHLLVGDHDDDGDADIYNHALDELYVQAGSAPRLVARTPARGSTDIAVTSSLTLTFDEAVVAGAGAIVVRDASPNTVVEHVSVTGDAGQISGTGTTTVTITPSVPWPFATTLTVTVEPGAFVSAADGDAFAGAAPVTWLFTTAANTPPQLANLDGDTVTWVEGDSAVALDAAAPSTVVDGDGVGFDGGSLSVAVTDAVAGEDRLSFAPADHLGSVSSDDTTLTIALDGDADAAALGALLHSLAYENDAGDDPTPGDRVVTVTLTDQGGLTSTAIITVSVVAVNDPPVISAPAGYLVDAGAEVTIGDVTIEDVDSDVLHLNATVDVGAFGDGTTTFTRDGSAADLMTAIDNGELRWVAPSDAAFGLLRLTVDDGDADATADVTLEVDAPPEPPPSKPGAPSRPGTPSKPGAPSRPGTPSAPGSPRAPEQPSVVKPQPQSLAAPPPWHDPIGETTPRPESTSSAVAPPDASPPLGTARVADAAPAPATTPERDARGMRWGALAMLAMGGGIVLLLVRRRRDDERRAPQL